MMASRSACIGVLILVLAVYGAALAQNGNASYRLEVKAGQNLQDAIEQLGKDYQIDFAYAPGVLAERKLEPAQLSAPDIEQLLQQLLADEAVQYHMMADNRILLRGFRLQPSAETGAKITLAGRIVDAGTGAPMMNVAIALDTLNLGTSTDTKGQFTFQVPAQLEDRSVWIYHIGYKTEQLPLAACTGGRTIRLTAEPFSLNEVLIIEKLPGLQTGTVDGAISMREDAMPGARASMLAGNDVFRQVQLLAGVSADNDLSSDIRIRGSDASETLIVLDGMPLYKVEHFYGVFSALNSSYLDKVTLYKNVLPIQYGGRTGGMLLMESAKRIDKLSGQADLNLLSAALTLDIPLSRRLGLSLSGRRSHTDLTDSKFFDWVGGEVENYVDSESPINRPEVLNTDPSFGFSDWNAKLLFRPNDRQRLSLNFYHSRDNYLNRYYNSFRTRFNQDRIFFEEDFNNEQDWQNTGTSLQFFSSLGEKWSLSADAFYTEYRFDELLAVAITRTSRLRGTQTNALQNNQANRVGHAGGRLLLSRTYAPDRSLQWGAGWNHYRTDFTVRSEIDTLISSEGSSFDAQAYAQYEWTPVDQLKIGLGGRINYYRQTNSWHFAPRLTAAYHWDSGFSLKGAYSLNYQFIREITHENRLGQSVDLVVLSNDRRFPIGQSHSYMLGMNHQFGRWQVDVEFYHKKLENVIEHSSLILGFGNDPLRSGRRQNYSIFQGEGTVNGVDLTLAWEYPSYDGHLAYTLSKALSRFPAIQRGAPIPSRDDRRHQLKWVNAWRLGAFDLSANYVYISGRPYYDQRQIQLDRRGDLIRWLPSYQRVDVGVDYHFKLGPTKARVGLSVFNLTNNENVKYLQFIYSTSSEENNRTINRVIGSQTELLDRTLNVSLGLEF